MKNQKVDNRITLKEFRELHSKRQSKTLTPFEKYKIRCVLKNLMQENILIHLYTKFLYFGMIEFNQRKFDIKIEVGTCTDDTITNHLKALQKMGYITQEFKRVKDKKYKRLHFNINIEKMNEILTTGEELKPENFSRLIETLRRQNEVVKPNPFDTTKKKDTPKVETTDNKITDNSIATTYKPNDDDNSNYDDDEMIDNDVKEVIRPVKEPIEERDERDDEMIGIGFKELKPAVERDEPIDKELNEHTPINPIVKPINEIEIINNKNETIMRETDNDNTDNDNTDDNIELNERTRLILKYKDYEGVKPVLKDLMLSTETINYLYSNDYKEGLDERLDDKKLTLDILFNMRIKPLLTKI